MLTKILINNEAYEVDLLDSEGVIEQIKKEFIGDEGTAKLKKENKLDFVIAQYIDYYEKVEYNGVPYFILKSLVPLQFKHKTYNNKFEESSEIGLKVATSLFLPITFIITNTFEAICNIKNMVKSTIGSTKINANFNNSQIVISSLLLVIANIMFWVAYFKLPVPFWIPFVFQAINVLLCVLKPFKHQYNKIENYKLCAYTFDSNYNDIIADPMKRLTAMKTTHDKIKIDFDFTKEDTIKEKGVNHATY